MIEGVDHVACTVPDLDVALALLVEELGCELRFRYERHPPADDGTFLERMNADPGTWFELAMVGCGEGTNIELFQYHSDAQRSDPPRNSDVGGLHVAFGVSDLDALERRLSARTDVRKMGPTVAFDEGPLSGSRSAFWLTSWGLQLELLEHR